MAILRRLYEDDAYEPDSYIAFSEYVFSIINSVSRLSATVLVRIKLTHCAIN